MSFAGLPLLRPFRVRNFRLLWSGDAVSVLGDQFYLVALPWLVLERTGSGLAVGTVMMVTAIPRAVLMLLGGVVTDRLAPRSILLGSNAMRGLLVGVVAALIWTQHAELWHLYVLALLFGIADAFSLPAFTTLVARVVPGELLAAANGVLQGTAHLSMFIGPAAGGVLVAAGGSAAAFAIDAASFLFVVLMLLLMTVPSRVPAAAAASPDESEATRPTGGFAKVTRDIGEGFRYAWHDPATRAFLLLIAAVNLAVAGPFMVGVAALAARRFGGAIAFGTMLSGVGGGALLGSAVAGSSRPGGRLGMRLLAVSLLFAIELCLLGFAPNVWVATGLIATMGLGAGYTNVLMVAWLQGRTPPAVLGRVMSMVMFAALGLQPVSYAGAGLLVDLHPTILFLTAGSIVLVATAVSAANPAVRQLR